MGEYIKEELILCQKDDMGELGKETLATLVRQRIMNGYTCRFLIQ